LSNLQISGAQVNAKRKHAQVANSWRAGTLTPAYNFPKFTAAELLPVSVA
jgi:hypothetical protein